MKSIWRDRHVLTQDPYEDIRAVAHRRELKARPNKPVLLLPNEYRFHPIVDANVKRYVANLMWVDWRNAWESFDEAFIDLGVQALPECIPGFARKFRIEIMNLCSRTLEVEYATTDIDAISLEYIAGSLAPGTRTEITASANTLLVGEWTGSITLTGHTKGGDHETYSLPIYLKVVPTNNSHPRVGKLPYHAPQPFQRYMSNKVKREVKMDPFSTRNMHSHTPGARLTAPGLVKPDMKACKMRTTMVKNAQHRPSSMSFSRMPRQGRGDWSFRKGNNFSAPANPETKARIGLPMRDPYKPGRFARGLSTK